MTEMLPIKDLDNKDFDPFMSDDLMIGTVEDPYSIIAEYRKSGAVHKLTYRKLFGDADMSLEQFEHYTIFGYDEVAAVFADPVTYSNEPVFRYNFVPAFGRSLTAFDAPEHSLYRRLFNQAFKPANVKIWAESLVAPAVDELISAFEKDGNADLVSQFTKHYPFIAVFRLMGLPEHDIKTFHRLAEAQGSFAINLAQASEAAAKLGEYFTNMIAMRRETPTQDIVSLLANSKDTQESVPDEVLISFLRQLINAAADTTYRSTSTMLVGLLRDPEQVAAITADRKLIPQTVEEGLRWDGPVLMTTRYVSRDVTLGGVDIPAGSCIDVLQGSANRDETKFEDPDKFNIFRSLRNRAMVFGQGPHICIGRPLAKISIEIALNALLDRLPNLRLDPDRPAPVIRGMTFRVPRNIFVKFG